MNFLAKDIIQELLPNSKVTVLYPGAFKPPHKGHFEVAKKAAEIGDNVVIIVSPKDRDGVTAEQSLKVWNLYKKFLPNNVEIRIAQGATPVNDVYDIIKNNPDENFLAAFGKEEGSRFNSLTKSGKYPNADIVDIGTIENFSATNLRKAIRDRDIDTIEKMIPDGVTVAQFLEAMGNSVHENLFLIQEDELMDEVVNPDGDIFDYTEKSKGLFIYNDSKDNVYFVRLTFQPTENPYFELKTGWFEDNDFSKSKYEPNLPPNSTSLDNIKRRNTVSKIYRDKILPLFKQASSLSKLLKIQPISQSRFIFSDRLVKNHTPEGFDIGDDGKNIFIYLKEISDPSSIDPKQLKMGIEVEKEHTDDPVVARKIAIDHLKEDPKYYTKLSTLKLEEQEDPLQEYINSINQFMVDKGLEIMPFPQVQYVTNDEENASQILGKTAYYNPDQNIIVLYTLGRHPKDILRSYAHELIHHAQNLQGRIHDVGTTDVNEDDKLFKLEEEAYVLGNMIFRSWENGLKGGINEETKPKKYYIFCDMDGVLVDFDKGYEDLTGVHTKHADVQNSKDFWNKLESSLKEKGLTQEDYWKNLDWMPDGKTLWDYIKQYNPYVLTAPSRDPGSKTGKKEWVERLDNMKNIYFRAAQSKSDFAGKNKILIDDRKDTIESWRAKGGIGILHTSAADTIKQLKQLGL